MRNSPSGVVSFVGGLGAVFAPLKVRERGERGGVTPLLTAWGEGKLRGWLYVRQI